MRYIPLLILTLLISCSSPKIAVDQKPNFIIIYTDDQRYDAIGAMGKSPIITPNMDRLAAASMIYQNAFVTLSICSPSRAALLTGRYGSKNGVTIVGHPSIHETERLLPQILKTNGYRTGLVGKWHLKNSPESCGFDYFKYFYANGSYYEREVIEPDEKKNISGYIEDYNIEQALEFIEGSRREAHPYFLFLCTQLPHMNNNLEWDVKPETRVLYDSVDISIPGSYQDDLSGKPEYLKTSRSRTQALRYGYADPDSLKRHKREYYSAVTELDASFGRLVDYILNGPIKEDTYFFLMGDNGWFLGEHSFTSKVLAYEESIRVPLLFGGPGIKSIKNNDMVLNIDIMPTILKLAGCELPDNLHGSTLAPTFNKSNSGFREFIYYEAPESQLGSYPQYAVRSKEWKLIQTYDPDHKNDLIYEELYDLRADPFELNNVAMNSEFQAIKDGLSWWMEDYEDHLNK